MTTAFAPGRVNLLGEHTDYTGGLALPIAVSLGTTATFTAAPGRMLTVATSIAPEPVVVDLDDQHAPAPAFARLAAALARSLGTPGGLLEVTTTLPVGAGLSSSASYAVACALALGDTGAALDVARRCQVAEAAAGSAVGLLDQLASLEARAGHAVLLDFTTFEAAPVALPPTWRVLLVDTGERRNLATSPYADRRAACEAAADRLGPLRSASPLDVATLTDHLLPFARHVVTENARVLAGIEAIEARDAVRFGRLLDASHRSLRDDFAVTTPAVDAVVDAVRAVPGVLGARLTGAGFGGWVVAMATDQVDLDRLGVPWMQVEASAGARRTGP